MKSNKLIIAAAGAGKTTFLVRDALKQTGGRVLITTYTKANETEIRKKFIEIAGYVPSHVTIQTWFSTLLQHGIRPYQGGLYEEAISGMQLVNEQSGYRYTNGRGQKVYYGETTHFKQYYISKDSKVYSDKISKLVVRCNEHSKGAVIDRLSRIYRFIFVDEVQDLAGYDLEILKLLMLSNSNIIFVGDPRQVTYLTHNERKYSQYRDGRIKEFISSECGRVSCEIDEETLNVSHRNNAEICQYSSRLYPDYKEVQSNQHEKTGHDGVFLVRSQDVDRYLERYTPIQLSDSRVVTTNKDYPRLNFGESKGLTYERVLIYPTQSIVRWINGNDYPLPPISRSKLYVALTRAKYSVGIIFDYNEETKIDGVTKYVH